MKSVLIIGATQGTGFHLAAEYGRRGANVVITGRDAQRAADVAEELSTEATGTVTGLALDLTRPGELAVAWPRPIPTPVPPPSPRSTARSPGWSGR
jgi:short-subunit dehydrogenase